MHSHQYQSTSWFLFALAACNRKALHYAKDLCTTYNQLVDETSQVYKFCVCVYIYIDGWMDGWVGGWVDGWMDGCVYIYITIQNIYMGIVRTFLGFAWETWIYKHD